MPRICKRFINFKAGGSIMKTLVKVLAVAMVASLLIAGNAMADYVNLNRPFTPGLSDVASEHSLAQILTDNTQPDVSVLAQSDAALWTTAKDGDVDSYLIDKYRGDNGTLGIYSALTGATYDFDFGDANSFGFSINDAGDLWFGNTKIDDNFGQIFGFYWKNTDTPLMSYTEDSKNTDKGYGSDKNILALAYLVPQGTTVSTKAFDGTTYTASGNDWILAFEDRIGEDGDFNDAVFYIEDMNAATPEPATMILLGFGLVGLAALRRKLNK